MTGVTNANKTHWLDEWFLVPKSLKASELASFMSDTDKMGSFIFMWFMIIILFLLACLILSSLYEYLFAMKRRLAKQQKEAAECQSPVWVSTYDYHTKLTPSQQEAYLDYSQRMFELQRKRLESGGATISEEPKLNTEEGSNWLKTLTQWTGEKAHIAKWSRKQQRNIKPEDMV
ncbi:HCL411Cp [Eremothecium sinecaudum]|uniref:HCL411Cp n=1 Tax=Eremothecium sinecaudum TaxID=45286 RepID=A0A120K1T8_9SACH|nr:HCL411Cp [Eremothecium sinecaudum]AMD19740.1 HCL411Cp [Eremothecium sinecaudum]